MGFFFGGGGGEFVHSIHTISWCAARILILIPMWIYRFLFIFSHFFILQVLNSLNWPESSREFFWSPVVDRSVCKIFTFSSSPEQLNHFNQTWHKASLGKRDSNMIKWKGLFLFLRGDNNKIAKIQWQNFKIFILVNHYVRFNQTWHK